MASSSPASIKSQAHNFSRAANLSPLQTSDHEIRSQVPFCTQVPYDRSSFDVRKDQGVASNSKPSLDRAPQSNTTSTELQRNRLDGEGLPEAQERDQSYSRRSDAFEKVHPAAISRESRIVDEDDEDENTSSDESIECEPLGRLSAVTPVEQDTDDVPASQVQPFPLVEWIRRIREESKPVWPTLPLRWARSIPKQQKAILDSDDAWYPPLPGRPVRQGTIPIDILTALTRQVDQAAEEKARKKLQPPVQELSHSSGQQNSATQPHNPASSPPDPEVLWSSSPPSPPRRLLPPDTSPPRPASKQEQTLTTVNENLHRISQGVPASSNGISITARQTTHGPYSSLSQIEPSQNGFATHQEIEEEGRDVLMMDSVQDASLSQEKSPISLLRKDSPITSSGTTTRLPETMPRPRPRIQVKDTPYPFKRPPQDRQRSQVSDDLPQSSLVAGTYPEATVHDRRSDNPPECEVPPAPRSTPARVIAPQADSRAVPIHSPQPTRSLKRTFDKVTQEAQPVVAGLSSPRDRLGNSTPNMANNTQLERRVAEDDTRPRRKQPSTHSSRSPSTSEYKAEEEIRLRNKELLNAKRLKQRRAFRASISTSLLRDGVKHVLASNPHVLDENIRATSAAPSSPKSHAPTMAGSHSDGEETSATNLSLHDTNRPKKPTGRSVSRPISVNVAGNSGGLDEMFQSFMHTYPDYLGSFKNFESALRLLIKLRSKPREPHPSLWDDFVFRMADDYKVYLQECIEEAESALPYQDFYYAHVKQSEHKGGVITAEILKIATSSTVKAFTPPKRSGSNLLSHEDVVMVDADTSTLPPARIHDTRLNVHNVEDLQSSREHRLPTAANRMPVSRKPDKLVSNELIIEKVDIDKARKRQSMPWSSSGRSLRDSVMLQTQQILASSGEPNNATTVVEEWLSRPTGVPSPATEPTPVQVPVEKITAPPLLNTDLPKSAKKKVVNPPHVPGPDLSKLRLPKYLASPRKSHVKDINTTPDPLPSVTASDITPQVERPVTPFTLFARNFANLQVEKSFRNLSASKRRLPINVYEW